MKYPKKREGEKGHQDAIDDLYVARKKFHQVVASFIVNLISHLISTLTALSNCLAIWPFKDAELLYGDSVSK